MNFVDWLLKASLLSSKQADLPHYLLKLRVSHGLAKTLIHACGKGILLKPKVLVSCYAANVGHKRGYRARSTI